MLTSLERMGSLMQGKLPDRVPVVCNLLEQGARELGVSIKKYYSEPGYIAEAQLKMQRKYKYDIVWGFSYTAAIAEIVGCKHVVFADDGPPNVGHLVIQKESDIRRFEIPENIEETPAMQKWLKCIQLLKDEVGATVPIVSATVSSFTMPSILMGMEKWMELLVFGSPKLRDEMLEKCSILN
ncbi:MAG: hypothetical protein MI922_03500, partial [Bacteroidales bacterium]|nr:hypothetical protein [Bacteroidales bacterium]